MYGQQKIALCTLSSSAVSCLFFGRSGGYELAAEAPLAHRGEESGLEEISIGLGIDVPPSQAEIDQYVSNSRLPVPDTLVELYRITDGLVIEVHFFIAGIFSTKHGLQRTLAQLNDLFRNIAGQCESHDVGLVIGSNQASGDLLAIDKEGSVVGIWPRDPRKADILASSLDEFLDEVCLGTGFPKDT